MGIFDKKAAFDIEGLPEESQKIVKERQNPDNIEDLSGIGCTALQEPVPTYNKGDCEVVLNNDNNAWIVLGRDRPGSKFGDGYGPQGATGCGSIDLVVGRMSANPKSGVYVDPNFESDAARIYISQKTDIDKNLDLVEGGVGLSKAKSGIGIKADSVRLVGREGVKIIAGGSKKNSLGGKIRSQAIGIDLIGANDDSPKTIMTDKGIPKAVQPLQPMVKGDNLVDALEELVEQIEELNNRMNRFAKAQMKYNRDLLLHTHEGVAGPVLPPFSSLGPATIGTQIKHYFNTLVKDWPQKINFRAWKNNYLKKGDLSILSKHNRTT